MFYKPTMCSFPAQCLSDSNCPAKKYKKKHNYRGNVLHAYVPKILQRKWTGDFDII